MAVGGEYGEGDVGAQRQRVCWRGEAARAVHRCRVGGAGALAEGRVGAAVVDAVHFVAELGDELVERSEEHTSELQSLMRISYAVFCLKKKKQKQNTLIHNIRKMHKRTVNYHR